MKETTDRRYPTGKFEYGKNYSLEETRKQIKSIARVPKDLKKLIKKLRDGALDKSYRAGGWTARQVIHHLADSHLNAYVRFKLAATENAPIIKPYEENLWAEIEDAKHGSPKTSLKLLSALHERWIDFLMALSDDDLDRGYFHPASKRTVSLREAIALYAWHGKHHLAHIKMVADGNFEKASDSKKAAASKAKDSKGGNKSIANVSLEVGAKPKKRVMSEAHKDKIRAAQQARRAAEKDSKPGAAVPAKRGQINTIQAQMQSENQKAQAQRTAVAPGKAKRGRPANAAKPVVQKAAPEKAKRGRRSSAEVAAEKAAKAAAPKLSRGEILAKARAAAAANRAASGKPAAKKAAAGKAKPGRPSKIKAAVVKAAKPAAQKPPDEKGKRGRPSGIKSAVVKAAKPAAEKGKRGRPSGIKSAVVKAAKAAAEKPAAEKGKRGRKPNPAIAAAKAAKAAAPKLSRAEVMEKARAAAAANRAAKAANAPKKVTPAKSTRVRRSSAEVAAEKAAKAAMPKLSRAEVMEKARAAAAANRAAKGQPAKPKKDPNAPKLTREQALAKARQARTKK